MTTGEGAMIVTGSKKIYDLCSSMRNQGRKIKDDKRNKDWDWLTSERLGYNYRLDEMSAALGVTQLKKLDWLIGERKRIVGWYNEALANLPGVLLPQIGQNRKHSWFLYVVRITNGKRDQLMSRLTKIGIEVRPYFPAIHLQPFMKQLFGYKEGDFPVCEKIASQTLALPLYIGLKKSEVQYIASQIRKFLP
jgi:perosamine synthetase